MTKIEYASRSRSGLFAHTDGPDLDFEVSVFSGALHVPVVGKLKLPLSLTVETVSIYL